MAHQVVLSWQASPDAGDFGTGDGYVVFKGPTSGGETIQVNPTPTTALTLTDSLAQPGGVFYAVKSSINGVLSQFSNSVESVILPSAPLNLVLVSAS